VLLTRPYVDWPTDPPHPSTWWTNYAAEYNAATKEVAVKNSVLLCDIYAEFEGKKHYFSDESHFTEEGHRRMARIVHEQISAFVKSK
jgi:lysophospholipase L1-like esterase